MMLRILLQSEWMKIKRKGLWLLAWIGPLGVVGLTMVNYGVRKDYLLAQSDDDWAYYLEVMSPLASMAIVLGIVILTSMLASIEGETNAWKMWLSLPVRRSAVYMSKYLIASILIFFSSTVLAIATTVYGLVLGLGDQVPWLSILNYSFYPWLSAQAIIALHLWCATISSNQGFTVTAGVIGVVASMMSFSIPDWVIWTWPSMLAEGSEVWPGIGLGVGVGFILFAIGSVHFSRKDVA